MNRASSTVQGHPYPARTCTNPCTAGGGDGRHKGWHRASTIDISTTDAKEATPKTTALTEDMLRAELLTTEQMLGRFIYIAQRGRVRDTKKHTTVGMRQFRNTYAASKTNVPGKTKPVCNTELWLGHPERITVYSEEEAVALDWRLNGVVVGGKF